jgi:hypothetical protein
MSSNTRSRSLARNATIAAISLLAAGLVTVLGVGLEGLLWQIKNATAAINSASAEMEKAKAQMQQAHSTVKSAELTAQATVQAAVKTAEASVISAKISGDAAVDSAKAGNASEVAAVPAIKTILYDPMTRAGELQQRKVMLKDEITTGLAHTTQQPLTPEEIALRQKEVLVIDRLLDLQKEAFQQTVTAGGALFIDSLIGMFRQAIEPKRPVEPARAPAETPAASMPKRTEEELQRATDLTDASLTAVTKLGSAEGSSRVVPPIPAQAAGRTSGFPVLKLD